MLRVRKTNGELTDLAVDARFIEVVTQTGKLAAVVYLDDDGLTHLALPGEPEFLRYIKLFSQDAVATSTSL
jgi:hypothetical protein